MKSVLNYKRPAFWITILAVTVCIIVAICFLTNPEKEYQIRITIPAGSTEEINVEKRDITHDGVADYIVTSMTYLPEVVDVNATLEEKIAQQVMYDIVSVKVYAGNNTSDTYDDKDYLLASNLWAGQGTAAWELEVFSLNETGDKEIIEQQSVEFQLEEDEYADAESYAGG